MLVGMIIISKLDGVVVNTILFSRLSIPCPHLMYLFPRSSSLTLALDSFPNSVFPHSSMLSSFLRRTQGSLSHRRIPGSLAHSRALDSLTLSVTQGSLSHSRILDSFTLSSILEVPNSIFLKARVPNNIFLHAGIPHNIFLNSSLPTAVPQAPTVLWKPSSFPMDTHRRGSIPSSTHSSSHSSFLSSLILSSSLMIGQWTMLVFFLFVTLCCARLKLQILELNW